jgi:starch synthase
MRVLHVASEVAPFAQSGGLADVLAGLPRALAESHGLDVAIMVPLYRGTEAKLAAAGVTLDAGAPIALEIGWHRFEAALRTVKIGRVTYGFVDCAPLYDRAGSLYGPGGSGEFTDNHVRFAALGKAAVEYGARLLRGPIDVLHVHDWQGALAAIYARVAGASCAIATTVHNLAFRGIFPKHVMLELGLPWSIFTLHQLEFWDQVCLLKGAMAAADVVTTVSPTYAHEILTPERGEALDAFIKADVRRLVGIVNGIDVDEWNPATDPALPAHFSRDALAGKVTCRHALAEEMGLAIEPQHVLLGAVARMTGQKGFDLVADIVPELERLGARLIVLGSGEPDLEDRYRWLADVFSHQVAVRIGFDLALSHRVYAGCDAFVMPSRFEPCGLGQLYAMRYGTIPVVTSVGGLRDTVRDPGTGIRFEDITAHGLLAAVERAVDLIRAPSALARTRQTAMSRDSSWAASALQYLQLYRSIVDEKTP